MPTLHKNKRKRPWHKDNRTHGFSKKNQDFYNSSKWRNYSRNYRLKNRRCYICNKIHADYRGLMVEHVIPIEQGGSKWDERNHGSICKNPCAKIKTGKERQGLKYEYQLNANNEKIPI